MSWSIGRTATSMQLNGGELSRLVGQAAEAGDEVANAILRQAGEELYQAARAVIDRLGMRDQRFPMILQGGVLQTTNVSAKP